MKLRKEIVLSNMFKTPNSDKRNAVACGVALSALAHVSGNKEKMIEIMTTSNVTEKRDLAKTCANTVFDKINESISFNEDIQDTIILLITNLILTRSEIFRQPMFNLVNNFYDFTGITDYIGEEIIKSVGEYISLVKEAHAITGLIIAENCADETHDNEPVKTGE